MGVFAHDLLSRYGVRPAYVAGHSYGEYVALWAAGCIDWDNLIQLSGERGRLAHEASRQNGGTMAAVVADADTTARHLRNIAGAELANLNSEDQTVIAGPIAAIDKAVAHFASVGIQAKKISVTAAFHTAALQGASEALASRLGAININIPQLPVYSNSTAERYPSDPAAIRQLLANHIAKPVRFREQIERMHADGARLFIEVGAGSVLTRLVGRILRDKQHKAIALDGGVGSNWTQFGKLLGQLFVAGKPVTVESWFENRGLQAISVADYLAELRNREVEKPTDWMLSPGGARQVGKSKTQPNKLATGQATQPAKVTNQPTPVARVATNGVHRDVASNGAGQQKKIVQTSSSQQQVSPRLAASSSTPQLSKGRSMSDLSHTNGESSSNSLSVVERSNGVANGHVVASHDALGQFQAVMGEWLKLQQGQMRLNERFLETQENVMRASLGFDAPARAKSLNGSNGAAPVPSPAIEAPAVRPQIGLAVAPAPVLPTLHARAPQASPADQLRAVVSTQDAVVVASPTKPAAPPAPVQKVPANVAPPTSKESSNNSSGQYLHTTEEFREALLNAVSERTGYPLDMLDENAALEAELGIDSIKTVEIFSSLSQFHAFLPGSTDDQDETINSFAQLKTLRDIVNVYDNRRSEQLAPGSNGETDTASSNGSNGALSEPAPNGRGDRELVAAGTVERFTVEAVAAPQVLDSKKKPSLETISS